MKLNGYEISDACLHVIYGQIELNVVTQMRILTSINIWILQYYSITVLKEKKELRVSLAGDGGRLH